MPDRARNRQTTENLPFQRQLRPRVSIDRPATRRETYELPRDARIVRSCCDVFRSKRAFCVSHRASKPWFASGCRKTCRMPGGSPQKRSRSRHPRHLQLRQTPVPTSGIQSPRSHRLSHGRRDRVAPSGPCRCRAHRTGDRSRATRLCRRSQRRAVFADYRSLRPRAARALALEESPVLPGKSECLRERVAVLFAVFLARCAAQEHVASGIIHIPQPLTRAEVFTTHGFH